MTQLQKGRSTGGYGKSIKYVNVSQQGKQRPYPIATFCSAGCSIAIGISALIIAVQYDPVTSPCSDSEFVIDLPLFLLVVGGIGICIAVLTFVVTAIMICVDDEDTSENMERFAGCIRLSICGLTICNLIWAVLGIEMFVSQMSADCQTTTIGIFIFAWSVFVYSIVFMICCCVCVIAGGVGLVTASSL